MDTKKEYLAPELTVVSFKTERGYAASNQPLSQLVEALSAAFNAYGIQTWEDEIDVSGSSEWSDWS